MNHKTFQAYRRHFDKNLWQSIEWANFQKALGKTVVFFGEDEAIGIGIIQEISFGLKYLEIPRGPLGITDKNFWKEVEKTAKEHDCIFTRISPEQRMQNIPRLHCTSDIQAHPTDTLIIDLEKSEEEILKQMKPKGRYNIRVAQRKHVEVEESNDVQSFYNILKETTTRDGFSQHPQSYYESMLEQLGETVKLYLASIEDNNGEKVYIAGGIFTFLDDTCTYYYGASSNKHRDVMAPYLVQWTAITEAQTQGMKYYDFLGIAPEDAKYHSLIGVTRFKKQFGGIHKSYPVAQDIIYKPFIYLLFRIYKFFRQIW